jgi:hypothetical protein
MRRTLGLAAGVALAASVLAACSRPADSATDNAAKTGDAAATTATDATGGAMASGGAVSPPPANGNEAINTDGNTSEASQSAGSNSFTEGQARGHIEKAGYTDVTGLAKTPDGMWTGSAKKDGKTANVSVDFKGAVTTK